MSCPSETRLQSFVDGELSTDGIADLSAHLDTCEDCRMLVGVVQPVAIDDSSNVDHVGRYVLRRVLGKGGMGVVYEAVDPELHRVVALKVLRSDLGGTATQKRLLGEAQAMALLSHPNVVTIHDVGRDGDRVFIVMTLIRGVSLRHWLARAPKKSLSMILAAFEQAGEGLRAAHDAGLVHRDFKPENVFVADEADDASKLRVLVGDFGLAVSLDDDKAHKAEGSLAYMAPEQRSGKQVDARSDQFSFCLALEEALRPPEEEAEEEVPPWLSKIIARGTKPDPADRYPSMSALLGELRRGQQPAKSNSRVIALAALSMALLGGVFIYQSRSTTPPPSPNVTLCHSREAEMTAIWNADIAKQTEAAFKETKSPLADGAWRKTKTVLDEYADAWRGSQRRTCEALTTTNATAIDQKMSCLGERLEIARAVTTSLKTADGAMLEQVPSMLQLLPRISACEDAREIAQLAPPPPIGAEKIALVDATKKKIATAAATIAAGKYKEGLALADEAWKSANTASYLPVLAEAYLYVGTAHGRLGHTREAEQALEQAASSASAGHAPAIAIRAWIQLMHFIGFEGKRYDDGGRYAEYAKAALEPLPGAFELEAERLSWSRAMLLDRKRFDDALVVSRQELALVELRFGPSHRLSAVAHDGLAGVLAGQCKTRDAIEPQEKACGIFEKEYGTPHPQLALCLGNLAALHANLGDHTSAMTLKRRALDMFASMPGHPNHVAMTHRNMVRSLLELGLLDDAKTELEAAAAGSQRASDETSILLLRGELHRREGKTKEALADHTSAVTRTKTEEPSRKLDPLLALAATNLEIERYADASTNAGEAATIALSIHGDKSCRVAEPLRMQADAAIGTNHITEALPLAERALGLLSNPAVQIDPLARARAEAAVARSLPASDRERARSLATSAREVASSRHDTKLVARIDAWLAR